MPFGAFSKSAEAAIDHRYSVTFPRFSITKCYFILRLWRVYQCCTYDAPSPNCVLVSYVSTTWRQRSSCPHFVHHRLGLKFPDKLDATRPSDSPSARLRLTCPQNIKTTTAFTVPCAAHLPPFSSSSYTVLYNANAHPLRRTAVLSDVDTLLCAHVSRRVTSCVSILLKRHPCNNVAAHHRHRFPARRYVVIC